MESKAVIFKMMLALKDGDADAEDLPSCLKMWQKYMMTRTSPAAYVQLPERSALLRGNLFEGNYKSFCSQA